MKNVGLKIIRGGAIGAFIGVVAGIGIPTALHLKDIIADIKVMEAGMEDIGIQAFSYQEDCGDLEDVILRFHVRANSNSDEDIALKLEVRDAVLNTVGENLGNMATDTESVASSGRDEVLEYVEDNLDEIEKIAQKVIRDNGYNYEVNAYISVDYFPMRQYGELTLPAGEYTALRIDIGSAEGENFWCLLYPTMCYTVDSEAFVSKEGEDKLQQALTEEDYDRLFVQKNLEKGQLKVKFKILEWIGK